MFTLTGQDRHGIVDILPVHDVKYQKRSAWGPRFKKAGDPFFTLTARYWKEGVCIRWKDGKYYRVAIRTLTPLEGERLQGFPDNWTLVDGIPERKRYQAVGEAVMPPVVQYIGEHL